MAYTGDQKRAYQLAWLNRRRQEWLDANGPCRCCGSTDNLEVDHVDPATKAVSPGSLWGMAKDNPKRITELAKCQVLCHDCHHEKTRQQFSVTCSERTVERKGCKCDRCRKLHVERTLAWRRRRIKS